jgi:hypothetical protein
MSEVSPPAPVQSAEEATALLERHAVLEAAIGAFGAQRDRRIAKINAHIDGAILPLLTELQDIRDRLEPWWTTSGKALAPKGRKSMELGGCSIGTKASNGRVEHGFASEAEAAAALLKAGLKKATKVSYNLDRTVIAGILKAKSKTTEALKRLGFSIGGAGETFFVKRLEQSGPGKA